MFVLVPSRAPSNVRVSNVRFDQVKVQWDPLPHQYINGRLLGYTIYYYEDYYSYLSKSVSTSNPYANIVILRGLKAATRYWISVAAFTSKGPGTQSYWQAITTGYVLRHNDVFFLVNFKILISVNPPAVRSLHFIINLSYLFITVKMCADRAMNSEEISKLLRTRHLHYGQ